jgi:hypothetical protein
MNKKAGIGIIIVLIGLLVGGYFLKKNAKKQKYLIHTIINV